MRPSSSYQASLEHLNERFKRERKPEIDLKPAPENLEDEDLLEMPNAGLVKLLVVDIREVEPNIHAGVKYIRFMIDRYYKDEPMDDLKKGLSAFAAYNAGPGRIQQLRREAAKQGLDPKVWFNNVERIATEKIGRETVTYVSNIYKYYIAYRLVQGKYIDRREMMKQLSQEGKQ